MKVEDDTYTLYVPFQLLFHYPVGGGGHEDICPMGGARTYFSDCIYLSAKCLSSPPNRPPTVLRFGKLFFVGGQSDYVTFFYLS